MPFKQGDSNINRNGRPKGATYSMKLRMQITEYCQENLLYFLDEIKNLKPGNAKSTAFIALLNFALPKLTESNSVIDIENLSPEDVDVLFNRIVND